MSRVVVMFPDQHQPRRAGTKQFSGKAGESKPPAGPGEVQIKMGRRDSVISHKYSQGKDRFQVFQRRDAPRPTANKGRSRGSWEQGPLTRLVKSAANETEERGGPHHKKVKNHPK